MKRFLILFVCIVCASFAQAAYLLWQVDSSDANTYGANEATFNVMQGTTKVTSFTTANMDTPIAIDFSGYNNTYSFYVELANWNSSTDVTTTMAVTQEQTYDQLSSSLYTGNLSDVTQAQVWHAPSGGYSPVPEPTSGLLMIVGMALLGLKRRKA